MQKILSVSFSVIIIVFVLAFSIQLVFAWTEPSASPPGGNVAAPINVSGNSQIKTGGLVLSNIFMNAVGNEGGLYNLDLMQGFNDLRLYGNASKNVPIYLEGNPVIINNDAGTGNVGIGTATPGGTGAKLDVVGGGIAVDGQTALSTRSNTDILVGDLAGGDGSRGLILRAGDADRVAITTGGNVGIGMANPYNALHVSGAVGATQWVGAGCEVNCESGGGYAILYPSGYLSLNGYNINSPQTSYGTIALTTSLNGYYGTLYGTGTGNANVMYDAAGNGGIYYQNWGWAQYYLVGSRRLNINTSTDLGSTLGVNGDMKATGYARSDTGFCIGASCITSWAGAGGGGTITGSGSANYIAKFTGGSSIGNSLVTDDGTTTTHTGASRFTGYGTDSWFPYTNGANYLRGTLYFNGVLYDENDTGYYVNPASTSIYNDLRANIFYDNQNTGYYVDPNGNTRLNNGYIGSFLLNWPGYSGLVGYQGNYIYPGWNDSASWNQSYFIYGNSGNSGLRTNGNWLADGNIYWGSSGVWLSSWLNQNVRTDANPTFGTVYTNNWFRSTGDSGWYSETYGGGWYMQDSTWIRSYNSKPVYMSAGFDTGSPSGVGCGGGLGGGYNFQVCGSEGITGSLSITGGGSFLKTGGGDGNSNVVLRKDGSYAYLWPWGTGTALNTVAVGGGVGTNFTVFGNISANNGNMVGSNQAGMQIRTGVYVIQNPPCLDRNNPQWIAYSQPFSNGTLAVAKDVLNNTNENTSWARNSTKNGFYLYTDAFGECSTGNFAYVAIGY